MDETQGIADSQVGVDFPIVLGVELFGLRK
jgi:hypothetical protein